MDKQIEELKELVRQNTAIARENNTMLRSMHRASRFSTFLTILWWVIVAGSAVGAYVYLQPYIRTLMSMYAQIQQNLPH